MDKNAALKKLLPSWRITITDLRSGVNFITTWTEEDRYMAVGQALRDTEARHPELNDLGTTHSITRVDRIARAAHL